MENAVYEANISDAPILRLEGITKRFGNLVANDGNTLSIQKGEVHVLFGENGAGKSTLSNMIYGYLRPTAGKMFINGEEVHFKSPRDAAARNIGMVHQHFMLVPTLTGMKNLLLGLDYGKGPFLDMKHAREKAQAICARYGFSIDLDIPVWRLSVGEQQWLEILKALFLGSNILILDEPTAVLTPQEADALLERVLEMKRAGVTIILVSHKLREIRKVADRITVLRRGKLIGTVNAHSITDRELIEMMIGRSYEIAVDKPEGKFGEPVLEMTGVDAYNDFGTKKLDHVELSVRAGEIFGIAGVSGNGQNELYEVITAVRGCAAGTVAISGQKVEKGCSFGKWHALKVAEIPEDRIEHATVGTLTLAQNILIGNENERRFRKRGVLNWKAVNEDAQKKIERFDVRPADLTHLTGSLSGGNMQKLVLSRELSEHPTLIAAAQPTRGLDVMAVEFIWKRLLEERSRGAACILISEDLDELTALSDRIGVIYDGRIVGVFEGDFPIGEIGQMMVGGKAESAEC